MPDLINSPELYDSTNKPEAEKDRLRVTTKDLVIGQDYDSIIAGYPNSTTETYSYQKDSVEVLLVTVTYTSASKKDIQSVVAT